MIDFPGNATLAEVQATRVILRRAGLLEALEFDETRALAVPDRGSAGSAMDAPALEDVDEAWSDALTEVDDDAATDPVADAPSSGSNVAEVLEAYRDRLASDPAGTLGELGVEPVSGDSASGYRLADPAAVPYLTRAGLQAGDVILSVNGEPVGDLASDTGRLDGLLARGSARLEIQRGGRRFFVTASLR